MDIRDMQNGDKIEGFYLLQAAQTKTTSAGKPYLSMTLADCTGTIAAQMWDYSGPIADKDAGSIVKVRAIVGEYRSTPQLTVNMMRLAEPGDPYDRSRLVPSAPQDTKNMWDEIRAFVDSVTDADYAAVCREMLAQYYDRLETLPAAKSVHHGFLGGLAMHTLGMLKIADFLAKQYASAIDRSLLIAGTLLHDFAKCEEYVLSPTGLVAEYSAKGELLGHLVLGAQAVAKAAEKLGIPEEKSILLQHMLLSHHGEPEFGAAVRPACAESELLSLIDLIDSRMEIYTETLAEMQPSSFSKRIFALDKRIYRHG
ncbi:MAG: HD domain-containing protein [Oscillospiraceae bacterium]|nr:HD domain-containing protein [Oscillospiraceae bacterium]